jgi:hypothetical protein
VTLAANRWTAAATGAWNRPSRPSLLSRGEIRRTFAGMSTTRMPVVYIPHGGGPWPFVDLPVFDRDEV